MTPLRPLLALILSAATVEADPLVTSWFTDGTGRYARIYPSGTELAAGPDAAVTTWIRGQGSQLEPTYAGVHEIATTDTDVYVRSTGLGSHIMGPWFLDAADSNLFPNYPSNLALTYRIPRNPGSPPTTKMLTGFGRIGLFVDGVSMFDSRDAFSYDTSAGQDDGPMAGGTVNGDGVWNRDAYVNESITFDAANAHQAGNHYHYHANPPALRHQLGDSVDYAPETNTYTESPGGQHSPILGWVRDGYPIYGPYGYSAPLDPTSAVTRMRSGYQKRNISVRDSLPAHAARDQGYTAAGNTSEYPLPANLHGPAVSAQFEVGHYLEDYEYLGDLGQALATDFDLDIHNGRYCVTPEFPEGTYAYFVSIEPDGIPKFPYNIGRSYYGNPLAEAVATIPNGANKFFEGGPEKPLENLGIEAPGPVTVTWSAVQGGTYIVERAGGLADWEAVPSSLEGDVLTVEESRQDRAFYRASLVGMAPFDDRGFAVDTPPTSDGNNVLLIIVDDWGIDSSPVDNPGGVDLPSMPTLESLAASGLRFTNAYALAQCSPTRATMLTGRLPFRHGIGSPAGATLPTSEITLPDAFASAGSPYALASIGKWHLGGGSNGPAELGGWTRFAGPLDAGVEDYNSYTKVTDGVEEISDEYATSEQVDDALAFIGEQEQAANPWFCWLAFNAPHSPYHDPPTELLPSGATGTSNRDRYEKMLEAMDTEIGRLLAGVDRENTNVILIGDNGTPGNVISPPFTGDHAKTTLYEGGLRVPLIATGPDVYFSGTNDSPVHAADIYATVLALAGISSGAEDSRSLLPAFAGGTIEGGVVAESFGNTVTSPGRALRDGDYKLIIYDDPNTTADTPLFEFYNIVSDPNEQTELTAIGLTPGQQAAYDALLAKNETLGGGFGDLGGGMPESTGILGLSPASGSAGSTVTVTFELDPDWIPRVPPLDNMEGNPVNPNAITIGTASGTFLSRPDRYTVVAEITLPNTAGAYDASVAFPGPNNPVFGLTASFQVTP